MLVWLILVSQSPAAPEATLIQHDPWPHVHHIVSVNCLAWPKGPGGQRYSFQAGYPKSLEVSSQELSRTSAFFGTCRVWNPAELVIYCTLSFASFPANIFFLVQDPFQDPTLHLIVLSPPIGTVPQSFFVFLTLILWGVLVRCFFQNVPQFRLGCEKVWATPPPKKGLGEGQRVLGWPAMLRD